MTKIKICGITNLQDGLAAAKLGVDALGFVFAESPRQVTEKQAKHIIKALPPFISKVGVFVDEDPLEVGKLQVECGLDVLQFHGRESSEYISRFEFVKLVKAIRVRDKSDLELLEQYPQVHAFLLDTWVEDKAGGSGVTFNWELAVEAKRYKKPIILAGGLTPENIVEAIKMVRPYAIDVSTGVEKAPGKKDYKKMKELIRKVRAFDYAGE